MKVNVKVLCWRIFAVTVVLGIASLFWFGGASPLALALLIATIVLFFIGALLKSERKETIARWVFALSFMAVAALAYWGFTLLPQGTVFGRQGTELFFWVEMGAFAEAWLTTTMFSTCDPKNMIA